MGVLSGVTLFLTGYIKTLRPMLNLLTNDGTILDKWRTSDSDITVKGPMFSINQTLLIKGLSFWLPEQEFSLAAGKSEWQDAHWDPED